MRSAVIDQGSPLLLGSGSPRRGELLRALDIAFIARAVEVDETAFPREAADAYLRRIVGAKLAAAWAVASCRESATTGDERPQVAAVLVADTAVLVDDAILGKPHDRVDAERMLRLLSGRAHEVRTRFALARAPAGPVLPGAALGEARIHAETVATRVVFRALDEAEIDGYVATGEGLDKAGAYAVQGLGSFAVERIEGSYTNVVGLPTCELVLALRRLELLGRYPR